MKNEKNEETTSLSKEKVVENNNSSQAEAEQENSALESTQQVSDDTKQIDLNSISETNCDSAETSSFVQPVTTKKRSNDQVITSSAPDDNVIEKFDLDLIKSKMQQATPDSSGKKEVLINLGNEKIPFSETSELISYIHNKNNDCDVNANGSGVLDLPLIMLISACKFGSRNAQFTTTLSFFENPKHRGKKRNELSANEQIALSVISKFSSKSSSIIKKLMLEGKTVVAGDAKKLGIIDHVTGLEDRDASARSAALTEKKRKRKITTA